MTIRHLLLLRPLVNGRPVVDELRQGDAVAAELADLAELESAAAKPGVDSVLMDTASATALVRAARMLSLSAEILAHVPSLVIVADRNGEVTFVSPSAQQMLGFEPEALMGDGWWALTRINEDEARRERRRMARLASGDLAVDETPYERALKDLSGNTRWFLFQDARGPHGTVLGVGQDITAAKDAVRALRDSEHQYHSLYRNMNEGVALHEVVCDEHGEPVDYVLLDVNPAYERHTGLRAVDVVGRRGSEVYGVTPAPYLAEFGRVALTGQPEHLSVNFAPMRRDFVISIFSPQPRRFATVFTDVTANRRLEEQLRQAQKMEAVGRLAGGIAHDFNNLLTAILGYTDLAIETVGEGTPLRDQLGEIRHSGERAAALTAQLLAFSRKQVLQPRTIDLAAMIHDMVPMLRRVIGEDIELVTSAPGPVHAVTADPNQMQQVVMNLAVNARDAMPTGGRLTIETAQVQVDADVAQQSPGGRPGAYVLLAVTDSGAGMDQETQTRVFEPFFTTKAPGKGTGLGLAMVYGTVTQSGGFIRVYSEPGNGAAFKIYLPAAGPDSVAAPPEAPVEPRLSGTETILVAEDESGVRRLISAALERYGYHVVEAANGGEALLACERYGDAIQLLISDVVMPRMSGPDLVALLRASRPTLKVLLLSGYPNESLAAHGVPADAAFMQKPFKPTDLVAKVREVLDR